MPKGVPNRSRPAARTAQAKRPAAAGAPAPRSTAASAPMEGAFYNSPGDYGPREEARPEPPPPTFNERLHSEEVRLERGGSVDREIAEGMAAETIDDEAALRAEIERIRAFRKPLGAYQQKLRLPERRGYKRHWFNDSAARVAEAEANGWSHVRDNDGKSICRPVGTGRDKGALYGYAMELPMVFWLEDMALRNKAASDKMAHLKANPFQAKRGTTTAADAGKFYDPSPSGEGPIQESTSLVRGI